MQDIDWGLTLKRLTAPTARDGFASELLAERGDHVFSQGDIDRIFRTYDLAKEAHRKQSRQGGGRYFEHGKLVALILIRLGVRDVDAICMALVHDAPEDAPDEAAKLAIERSIEAAAGSLTLFGAQLLDKSGRTLETYIEVLLANHARIRLVKLSDRLHNLSTLPEGETKTERLKYLRKKIDQVGETRRYILPLAESLIHEPGYEEIGAIFMDLLNYLCNLRENEVYAAQTALGN